MPGVMKVQEKPAPEAILPLSKEGGEESLATVWATGSSFDQLTVAPAATVRLAGEKAKLEIDTSPGPGFPAAAGTAGAQAVAARAARINRSDICLTMAPPRRRE
jgi:alkylhydroperoxidase family enzyme